MNRVTSMSRLSSPVTVWILSNTSSRASSDSSPKSVLFCSFTTDTGLNKTHYHINPSLLWGQPSLLSLTCFLLIYYSVAWLWDKLKPTLMNLYIIFSLYKCPLLNCIDFSFCNSSDNFGWNKSTNTAKSILLLFYYNFQGLSGRTDCTFTL